MPFSPILLDFNTKVVESSSFNILELSFMIYIYIRNNQQELRPKEDKEVLWEAKSKN